MNRDSFFQHLTWRMDRVAEGPPNMRRENLWMALGQVELALVAGLLEAPEACALEAKLLQFGDRHGAAGSNPSAVAMGNRVIKELYEAAARTLELVDADVIQPRTPSAHNHIHQVRDLVGRIHPMGSSRGEEWGGSS